MMETIEDTAATLRREGKPFAMALVVRCESPTSAKPGARGVISAQGEITGWIGGGCTQPIVIEESRRALRDGTPRLVRITPEAGKAEVDGIHAYEMLCYSGGTLDIFIEPVLPAPQVVILGRSPVARTLARLAKTLDYAVTVLAPGAQQADFSEVERLESTLDLSPVPRLDRSFVVVSTQGEDDEGGMEAALAVQAPYVAFVASPKKWKAVSAHLEDKGIAREAIDRVRVPAGIEINAVEPQEIALSIMAQIVSLRRQGDFPGLEAAAGEEDGAGEQAPPATAIDPICGMTVDIATAKHVSKYEEQAVYFCCGGCKTRFDADPTQYANGGGAR